MDENDPFPIVVAVAPIVPSSNCTNADSISMTFSDWNFDRCRHVSKFRRIRKIGDLIWKKKSVDY